MARDHRSDSESEKEAQSGTAKRQPSAPIPADVWESYKAEIKKLYIDENKNESEVREILAEKYDFHPT